MNPTYLLAGGGVAAASAAESLRGGGFAGRIVILGEEREAPYERPPLSKELLRGEREPASAALRTPEFYEQHDIELHQDARALNLDITKRSVQCNNDREFAFDKLLIATGAAPRRLDVPGGSLSGVHYLRTLDDAVSLKAAFSQKPRVLVIGTGFIGCEVAASARQIGCGVTLIGPSLPLERVLGKGVATVYRDCHQEHGVTVKSGITATQFRGNRILEAARLSDGGELECDVAVVGIGVVPNVGWLGNQITTSDGVDTDEHCRTSVDGIFAAGDVASSWRPRFNRRIRFEHFDGAESQGAAAGKSMLGDTRPYDPVPFFWSDQYDVSLQYYGFASQWDRIIFRGSTRDRSFVAFYLIGERIDAACIVNRSGESNAAKRLIGRTGINDADLTDEGKTLSSLIVKPT